MASTTETPLRRTFAQWYCVIAGATLLLAGIFGFAADGSFETGSAIQGDELIVFEVNGWHNLVHIASGLLLLAAANTRPTAKTVAYAFGAVYAFVALWGLVDGDEVFTLFPVNPADNILHIFLAAAAIACAYYSPTTKNQQRDRRRDKQAHKRGSRDDKERREFLDESHGPAGTAGREDERSAGRFARESGERERTEPRR